MPDVKLNSGSDDVGLKFKIIGAIGYFASTGKMAEMFGWKHKNKK